MKKHGGYLNAYYSMKEENITNLHMIPTIWHWKRGKAMDTVKRSVVVKDEGRDGYY